MFSAPSSFRIRTLFLCRMNKFNNLGIIISLCFDTFFVSLCATRFLIFLFTSLVEWDLISEQTAFHSSLFDSLNFYLTFFVSRRELLHCVGVCCFSMDAPLDWPVNCHITYQILESSKCFDHWVLGKRCFQRHIFASGTPSPSLSSKQPLAQRTPQRRDRKIERGWTPFFYLYLGKLISIEDANLSFLEARTNERFFFCHSICD